jgi:hypothetical protein
VAGGVTDGEGAAPAHAARLEPHPSETVFQRPGRAVADAGGETAREPAVTQILPERPLHYASASHTSTKFLDSRRGVTAPVSRSTSRMFGPFVTRM